MNTAEIKKMSVIDRLQAMEALWDSLLAEKADISPDWHQNILKERKRKIESNEAEFLSIEELKARHK